AVVLHGPGGLTNKDATVLITRGVSFFQSEYSFMAADGTTTKLPLPLGAQLHGMTKGNLILALRDDWKVDDQTYPRGALLAFPLADFLRDKKMPKIATLFAPDAHSTIDTVSTGRDAVYVSINHD